MKTTRRRRSSAAEILDEACQWRLLSLLLSRPAAERKEEVRRLAGEQTAPRLTAAANAWCDNAGEGAYLRLLGPGGLVPAREVAYRPFADPGWLLADVARSHRAFGFHPAAEEPPDHVAVLADFVSYLLLKEAYARGCEDDGMAEITREALEHFIEEHLAPVARRLAERLDGCGATDWSVAAWLLAERVPAPPPIVEAPEEGPMRCTGCAQPSEP
jgi:TorA maturation chaperone TorD